MPRYLLADAALFAGNAARIARVLAAEADAGIQEPALLGSQAAALLQAIARASADVGILLGDAVALRPDAAAPIVQAAAHLSASHALAGQVATAASRGLLGPLLAVPATSCHDHLRRAEAAILRAADAFGILLPLAPLDAPGSRPRERGPDAEPPAPGDGAGTPDGEPWAPAPVPLTRAGQTGWDAGRGRRRRPPGRPARGRR